MQAWYRVPVQMQDTGLTPTTRMIYAYMLWKCVFFQSKQAKYFEAQETIAKELGISRKTVNLSIQLLQDKGFLKIGKKDGRNNLYIVYDRYMMYTQD